LDPGKASGLSVYNTDTLVVEYMEEAQNGVLGFVPAFLGIKAMFKPDAVACESFTLRSSNKFVADLSPVESIGWLRGEGFKVTFVPPSTHKTLVKDAPLNRLMKAGGFPIGAGHTRDSLRVGLWYAAKVLKHRPTLELLSNRS
jgi:hypothetical protein